VTANKPIAFVTNGQSVPDDIAIADGEKIADLLLGDLI
jgi:flagellar biosynthesis GTPase FlhF